MDAFYFVYYQLAYKNGYNVGIIRELYGPADKKSN